MGDFLSKGIKNHLKLLIFEIIDSYVELILLTVFEATSVDFYLKPFFKIGDFVTVLVLLLTVPVLRCLGLFLTGVSWNF